MAFPDINLPFFTYGIFRPGEIPFIGIKNFVRKAEKLEIKGTIKVRDGVFLYSEGNSIVSGSLLYFNEDVQNKAYNFINELEPEKLFRWDIMSFNELNFNILKGRSPTKGSESIEELHYDYSTTIDPYFTTGLDLLREEPLPDWDFDLRGSFKIQMKYMFLWTIIERFTFLRYSLGGKPYSRIRSLSENQYFIDGLSQYVKEERKIVSADDVKNHYVLNNAAPKKAIDYYYQVRSNLTHRGKGIPRDYDILKKSFEELLNITEYVIMKTVEECQDLKQHYEKED